tara:strand:+ start:86 stop:304 length:219 start_codon:yes stop_codon:yes gene_type:complete
VKTEYKSGIIEIISMAFEIVAYFHMLNLIARVLAGQFTLSYRHDSKNKSDNLKQIGIRQLVKNDKDISKRYI